MYVYTNIYDYIRDMCICTYVYMYVLCCAEGTNLPNAVLDCCFRTRPGAFEIDFALL